MHSQESKTAQSGPTSDQAYNRRGIKRLLAGDLEGALADFDRALRLNPDYIPAYINRGAARHKAGHPEGALADFDRVIHHDPFDAGAYYCRGTVRYHMGDFGEALDDFDKAIRYNPGGYVEAHNNRGEAHLALGDYRRALADFEKTLELRPDYEYAVAGLTLTLYALGQTEEALSRWRALLDEDPRYSDAEWVAEQLNWAPPLVEIAHKLTQEFSGNDGRAT